MGGVIIILTRGVGEPTYGLLLCCLILVGHLIGLLFGDT